MTAANAAPTLAAPANQTVRRGAPASINLGIAVDVERKDGSRSLMVPCIKNAGALDFAGFHAGYEDLIALRDNQLAWRGQGDGSYVKVRGRGQPCNVQAALMRD